MKKLQVLVNELVNNQELENQEIKMSSYDDSVFEVVETDGTESEFLVVDEEEATDRFAEYQRDLIEEMGISCFAEWAQDHIKNNFVDTKWFEDFMREYYESYCEDIENEDPSDEDFENRLEEEILENGCCDKWDYIDSLCEQDAVQWYKDNFGDNDFDSVVTNEGLIDTKAVIEWVEETGGRGCLASYDGKEVEAEDGYYIYRVN
ncbi:MAG: hypothetical protein ACRCX8_14240 [Sarcina sp.]